MKQLIRFLSIIILLCSGFITCLAQSNTFEGVTFLFYLTDGKSDDSKPSFHIGEEIIIKTFIQNYSTELFPFILTDEFYMYKFSLTKEDGRLPVPYRRDKARLLLLREETQGAGRYLALDPIYPGNIQHLQTMKLSDRYENLAAGNYKLSIEYKTGKIIQIKETQKELRLKYEVAFEIIP